MLSSLFYKHHSVCFDTCCFWLVIFHYLHSYFTEHSTNRLNFIPALLISHFWYFFQNYVQWLITLFMNYIFESLHIWLHLFARRHSTFPLSPGDGAIVKPPFLNLDLCVNVYWLRLYVRLCGKSKLFEIKLPARHFAAMLSIVLFLHCVFSSFHQVIWQVFGSKLMGFSQLLWSNILFPSIFF